MDPVVGNRRIVVDSCGACQRVSLLSILAACMSLCWSRIARLAKNQDYLVYSVSEGGPGRSREKDLKLCGWTGRSYREFDVWRSVCTLTAPASIGGDRNGGCETILNDSATPQSFLQVFETIERLAWWERLQVQRPQGWRLACGSACLLGGRAW